MRVCVFCAILCNFLLACFLVLMYKKLGQHHRQQQKLISVSSFLSPNLISFASFGHFLCFKMRPFPSMVNMFKKLAPSYVRVWFGPRLYSVIRFEIKSFCSAKYTQSCPNRNSSGNFWIFKEGLVKILKNIKKLK